MRRCVFGVDDRLSALNRVKGLILKLNSLANWNIEGSLLFLNQRTHNWLLCFLAIRILLGLDRWQAAWLSLADCFDSIVVWRQSRHVGEVCVMILLCCTMDEHRHRIVVVLTTNLLDLVVLHVVRRCWDAIDFAAWRLLIFSVKRYLCSLTQVLWFVVRRDLNQVITVWETLTYCYRSLKVLG